MRTWNVASVTELLTSFLAITFEYPHIAIRLSFWTECSTWWWRKRSSWWRREVSWMRGYAPEYIMFPKTDPKYLPSHLVICNMASRWLCQEVGSICFPLRSWQALWLLWPMTLGLLSPAFEQWRKLNTTWRIQLPWGHHSIRKLQLNTWRSLTKSQLSLCPIKNCSAEQPMEPWEMTK